MRRNEEGRRKEGVAGRKGERGTDRIREGDDRQAMSATLSRSDPARY